MERISRSVGRGVEGGRAKGIEEVGWEEVMEGREGNVERTEALVALQCPNGQSQSPRSQIRTRRVCYGPLAHGPARLDSRLVVAGRPDGDERLERASNVGNRCVHVGA